MLAESETITGWKEQQPRTSAAAMDFYLRLAGAVVVIACKDAVKNTREGERAREWLLSDDAGLYLECLGIDREMVENWIQTGARIPKRRTGKPNKT